MKAIITNVEFLDEKEGQYGMSYSFAIHYDGKKAYYKGKYRDQKKFVIGEEAEFTEETHESKAGNKYFVVKPIYMQGQSNFSRQIKKEQSRYSGFAVSYVKDLIVAGLIPFDNWQDESRRIIDFMVAQDKRIGS